jgi:hypothetical protein
MESKNVTSLSTMQANGMGQETVLKTKLRQEQIWNLLRKLQDAADVVEFLKETLSNKVPTSYPDHEQKIADMHRKFWCMKEETLALHRLKRWNCDTI